MTWDAEKQRDFDALRARELEGPLSGAEQHALDELLAILDADEALYLAPTIERMAQEAQQREVQLATLQVRNEELAALVQQHEQLLREARTWLVAFEQRRLVLQDRYTRLTGTSLPSEPGR